MTEEQKYDDLRKDEPATQGDLEIWGGQLQHQMQGLEEKIVGVEGSLERKIETRAEETEERIIKHVDKKMDEWGERIMQHIDAAVESRQVDVGAANSEQVEMLQRRVEDHEERLTVVEGRG